MAKKAEEAETEDCQSDCLDMDAVDFIFKGGGE